jgi:hypothetical protein
MGVSLNDDDALTHFLNARYSIQYPSHLIDIWNRPLFNVLYLPASQVNLTAARLTSSLISLAICWLCFLYVKEKGYKRPYLVPVFLAATDLVTMSFNMDTAIALCLVLSLALVLYGRKNYNAAAVVLSFAPAGRPEGVLYIFIFALFFIYKKKWTAVPLLFSWLAVWNLLGFAMSGDPLWLIHNQPWKIPYGSFEFLHYFKRIALITGPGNLIFFLIGITITVLHWRKKDNLLLVLLCFSYFAFHVLTAWMGGFSTAGFIRYFNGTVPIIGILALSGFNWLLDSDVGNMDVFASLFILATAGFLAITGSEGLHVYLITILAVIVIRSLSVFNVKPFVSRAAAGTVLAAISIYAYYPGNIKELKDWGEIKVMEQYADFYKTNTKSSYVLCSDQWFYYFSGVNPFDRAKSDLVTLEHVEKAPKGTAIIWDAHYAGGKRYGKLPLDYFFEEPGYIPIHFGNDSFALIYKE